MDLKGIRGCCMWQGGVMKISPHGMVVCNSGAISEICSRQLSKKPRGTL
jgi:hypothetical protein